MLLTPMGIVEMVGGSRVIVTFLGSALNNPNDTCVKNLGPAPATTYQLAGCTDVMHGNVPFLL